MKPRSPAFLNPLKLTVALRPHLPRHCWSEPNLPSLQLERIGGFYNRSYTLRLRLARESSGLHRATILRASNDFHDHTRRQAYQLLVWLRDHGWSRGKHTVPEPVMYSPAWRMLIYHEAPGQMLLPAIIQHPASAGRLIKSCAQALAKLHQARPAKISWNYRLSTAANYWRRLYLALPKGWPLPRQRVLAAIRWLVPEECWWSNFRPTLVHHDFHPGNIIAQAGGRLVLLDFTESRLTCPLVDVATFTVQLELMFGRRFPQTTITRWRDLFWESYVRHQPYWRRKTALYQRAQEYVRRRINLQRCLGAWAAGLASDCHAILT